MTPSAAIAPARIGAAKLGEKLAAPPEKPGNERPSSDAQDVVFDSEADEHTNGMNSTNATTNAERATSIVIPGGLRTAAPCSSSGRVPPG